MNCQEKFTILHVPHAGFLCYLDSGEILLIRKLVRKQRADYYTCCFAKSSYNLMFKPIRSVVKTIIVKLERFCIPTSLRLGLSFSSE